VQRGGREIEKLPRCEEERVHFGRLGEKFGQKWPETTARRCPSCGKGKAQVASVRGDTMQKRPIEISAGLIT
jgi:hypothetical protein